MLQRNASYQMTEHYDARETREPAAREKDLFARLPEVLRKATAAPAYAERLKGIDPAVLSRMRRDRSRGCSPRRGRSSSRRDGTTTPGAAHAPCSRSASARAMSCSTPSAIT